MHLLDELSENEGLVPHSPLARCDVRVTLITALALILSIVVSTRLWLPLGALAGCLAVLLAGRMRVAEVLHRLAGPVVIALLVVALQAFTCGKTPLVEIPIGPWRLSATEEGLWRGLLVGSRVLGSYSVILALCVAMPPERLFAALRWARVPRTWIEIGQLMYRYIFSLLDEAATVLAAQTIRLGYAGFRRSLRSLGSLAGVITLRSIDQAERTHEAMLVRGYQGTMPGARLPGLSIGQWASLLASVSTIALLLLFLERGLP